MLARSPSCRVQRRTPYGGSIPSALRPRRDRITGLGQAEPFSGIVGRDAAEYLRVSLDGSRESGYGLDEDDGRARTGSGESESLP
jgi:hypothetical protein